MLSVIRTLLELDERMVPWCVLRAFGGAGVTISTGAAVGGQDTEQDPLLPSAAAVLVMLSPLAALVLRTPPISNRCGHIFRLFLHVSIF